MLPKWPAFDIFINQQHGQGFMTLPFFLPVKSLKNYHHETETIRKEEHKD